ncbi:MAG TPA: BMP family ABC transporter substrate-binding protein, partial [Stellaceae bacterium]|nr:BMP family ABC transporter substrate-binding protein [Stellaceae bacterium]
MKRRTFLAGAAALSGLPMVGGAARAADKLKVGFIYTGPIGDFGWSYQHDLARKAIDAALGDKVETVYVENVPEGPDAERVIEGLVRDGSKLVFTTSFGYMDPTIKVAARHPDVKFEHATGFKRTANVATYSGRFYEGRYVCGQMAAKMTKSGIVGYVGSFPIPEVVSGMNAFMLGAWSVKPDMKLKIVWAATWFDPGKEADAAKALIDQGADILTQHTDSPAAMQIAEQRGIHAFGQSSDMIKFGPHAQLTADT